jgi:hypothetical protein
MRVDLPAAKMMAPVRELFFLMIETLEVSFAHAHKSADR